MSRLDTLSDAAKELLFGQEVGADMAALFVLTGGGLDEPIYVTSCPLVRVSETPSNVNYGIVSNGISYIALPMDVQLPGDSDEGDGAPQMNLNDVTQQVLPLLRSAEDEITVDIQLVLTTTPDVVEMQFNGYVFYNFNYDKDVITCSIGMPNDEREPIPADSFTPAGFPGGF